VYDEAGRLIRSVTRVEPEWDAQQQAWMLALGRYRQETCNGCDGYLPETTDPENDGRYQTTGPFLCHRCEAIGRARNQFVKDRSGVINASRWVAELRPTGLANGAAAPADDLDG
jgi:hypothetical protein